MVKIGSLVKEKKDETLIEKREKRETKFPKNGANVAWDDQNQTIVKMQSDILHLLAALGCDLLEQRNYRKLIWSVVKTKLRKGVRPEQDALVELLEATL